MDKIIKKYSLKEIATRTHISPVVLQKLLNYQFETISKIKFNGFIKILENEFKDYDFKVLKEKAAEFYQNKVEEVEKPIKKEKSNFKNYLVVFILMGAIAFLMNYMNKQQVTTNSKEEVKIVEQIDKNFTKLLEKKDRNSTFLTSMENKTMNIVENNLTFQNNIKEEFNDTKIVSKEENTTLLIVPLQKVWYRITYLDTKKRKNYLTLEKREFNGSKDMYIEFGHGMESLIFKDKNITPKVVEKVNFILKNGELNITTKSVNEYLK